MSELYIGLMSGTSIDGIDAIIVDFESTPPKIIETHYEKMPALLRKNILDICVPGANELNRMGELDASLGYFFAEVVLTLLKKSNVSFTSINAIGSHGQTIRHHPDKKFSLQIGDPNIIASRTSITTVTDFRRRDIALNGQGAPLVPAFHQALFANKHIASAILNIGGIANLTFMPINNKVYGFDTGPGNTLLDAWVEKHLGKTCDEKGAWAEQGEINEYLLNQLLNDPYFLLPPPKSTGREYFNLEWLQKFLHPSHSLKIVDVQTTLVELTAQSITTCIRENDAITNLLVCGGGVHNVYLMKRLCSLNPKLTIETTSKYGIDPDWVEAAAFAWLAKQTLTKKTSNLTSVTGARKETILGGVYFA